MNIEQPGSGASGGEGGASTDPKNKNKVIEPIEPKKEPDEMVSRAELEKAVQASESYKKDMLKYKDDNAALRNDNETKERERLKGQEDQTAYIANLENSNAELEQKDKSRSEAFINSQRKAAVKEGCLKAGIIPEAMSDLDLLDMNAVQVELTDRGTVNVLNADAFVLNLVNTRKHWFKGSKRPNFNGGGGGNEPIVTTKLTAAYMNELETKKPEEYKKLMPAYMKQLEDARAAS